MRICTRCKDEKDLSSFYPKKKGSDKLKAICKECESQLKAKPIAVIPDLEGEVWVESPLFPDFFLISNYARVRRIQQRKNKCNKLVNPYETTDGYWQVCLMVNAKRHSPLLHRLVATAFIPNPENKPEVNHDDGDKSNNHVSNLVWATSKENIDHAWETWLKISVKGENHGRSKLTEKEVLEIRQIGGSVAKKEIAAIYGVTAGTIGTILNNKKWKHI